MDKELRILILEDVPADAELEEHELRKAGLVFTSKVVDTREAFLKELDEFSPDLILSDYDLPSFDGFAALRIAKEKCPDVPLILVTGKLGEEFAIEKLKEGATDYVLKGNLKRLVPSVKRALEEAKLITKRKQAEETLRESEERLQAFLDNAGDMIQSVDKEGRYIYVNQKWQKVLGYTPEEANKMTFLDIVPKDHFQHCKDIFERVMRGEDIEREEITFVSKDGKEIYVEASINALFENGEFVSCRGIFRDVTKRKQAEEALCESEEKYRLLFEGESDAILVFDGISRTIIDVNTAAQKLYGYSREEFLNMQLKDIAAEPEESEKTFQIALTGKLLKVPLKYHRKKDGTVFPVEISAGTFLLKGKPIVIGAIRDFTEKKLDEERLEALLNLTQMEIKSEKEITDFALEEAVRLTKSEGGYLHFFNEDEKTIQLYSWSKDVLKICTAKPNHHYPLDAAGVWADSIRLRKAVVHNDYQSLADKKGYPEGHFHLVRHLGIPIFDGDRIVGVTGVGNKEDPYDESDARQIILFMNSMWGILKQKRSEQERERLVAELQASSIKDELTGLYNRRGILSMVAQQYSIAKRIQKTLMLVYIDLDGMKQINDLYGHKEGDNALIDTANILKNTFRDIDIIARIGGDEFAVFGMVMEDKGLNIITSRINEKLEKHVGEYNARSAKSYTLSLSNGIAFAEPEKPFSFDSMLSEADQKMYLQKQKKESEG